MDSELQRRSAEEASRSTWMSCEEEPIVATSAKELMLSLEASESEAFELESQEQAVIDHEVARFSRSIH
jgi:hypothetical protein